MGQVVRRRASAKSEQVAISQPLGIRKSSDHVYEERRSGVAIRRDVANKKGEGGVMKGKGDRWHW